MYPSMDGDKELTSFGSEFRSAPCTVHHKK
jgi:hypothetical protein